MRALSLVHAGGAAAAASVCCLFAAAPAAAQDTLNRKGGGFIGQPGGVEIIDLYLDKIEYRLKGVTKQTVDTSQVASWEFGDPPKVFDDAESAFKEMRFDDAAKFYAQAAGREHKQKWVVPLSLFGRGEALRMSEAYAAAVDAYKQYLDGYANHVRLPEANIGIGQCYLATKRNDLARKAFEVVAGGKYGEAHAITGEIWKARILEIEGKWAEAKNAYAQLEKRAGMQFKDEAVNAGVRKNLAAVQVAIAAKDDGGLASLRSSLQSNLRDLARSGGRPDLEAAAWNGIGETHYFAAKPDWLEALVAFCHVFVRYSEQYGEIPKALYYGGCAYFYAADKIGKDPESIDLAKRRGFGLLGRLKNDFPKSDWARKPAPK